MNCLSGVFDKLEELESRIDDILRTENPRRISEIIITLHINMAHNHGYTTIMHKCSLTNQDLSRRREGGTLLPTPKHDQKRPPSRQTCPTWGCQRKSRQWLQQLDNRPWKIWKGNRKLKWRTATLPSIWTRSGNHEHLFPTTRLPILLLEVSTIYENSLARLCYRKAERSLWSQKYQNYARTWLPNWFFFIASNSSYTRNWTWSLDEVCDQWYEFCVSNPRHSPTLINFTI